ncbi:MAG: magnesium transporter [Candidatus Omnitrophica bacterium]|nr:magnesium transporter [Candidatus Omnitrophota bacterium]MBU1997355.1 magnesium transporter [Candidatus Omnitrophota bacterium]MBU4333111.1 magnesium transporter [Candidatus Omnitrophota bacterium]
MRDFIFSSRKTIIKSLTVLDPVYVDIRLDDLVKLFKEKKYVGIPVTNRNSCIVGVVRRKDVVAAFGERDKDTYLKASGIVGGEELRSMPLFQRSKRRLSWLSVNIILNIIAASVIAFYQDTLSAVIALAVFLPIISDMSGCSGNQAVAVSIRELAIGLVKPFDLLNVLIKEMEVGIINGIVLGMLLGFVAFLWKRNICFGLVVGWALALNTFVAVCLGGIIPLFLKRIGKDPALASGSILTTVTDMCGFFCLSICNNFTAIFKLILC